MTRVGLIKPDGDENKEANQALDRIMDALNKAYGLNNNGSQLDVFTYESSDAVDKEV